MRCGPRPSARRIRPLRGLPQLAAEPAIDAHDDERMATSDVGARRGAAGPRGLAGRLLCGSDLSGKHDLTALIWRFPTTKTTEPSFDLLPFF